MPELDAMCRRVQTSLSGVTTISPAGRPAGRADAPFLSGFLQRPIASPHTTRLPPMKSPAAKYRLTPEFDAFLFAAVGEDRSGMPLSVVSVLARLDLDPWQAAAELSALPPETAARKLVSILGTLSLPSLQSSDIVLIARRLVAMLPHPTASLPSPLRAVAGSAGAAAPRPHANIFFLAIYLLFMTATQVLMSQLSPPHADSPPAPVSSSAASQISPALSAK